MERLPPPLQVKMFGPLAEGNGTDLDEYVALVDGVFLNQVMFQINPKLESQRVNKKVNNDASLRIHNLSILVKQIKFYYQEKLQQLIVMSLPNVLVIGKNPFSEQGTEEVKKLLLLLLGCAVQCQKKEFIGIMQGLNFDTKAAVAAHIQEVINNQENVFDLQWMEETDMSQEEKEPLLNNMAFHLKRLIDERDEHSETIIALSEEQDGLHFLPHASLSVQSPCGSPGMKQTESRQHLPVELANAKAKIRRLRKELDENTEELLDCKEELEQM
ncbi:Girdin [Manis javanica]|nr:Girdin [Manis javanica]